MKPISVFLLCYLMLFSCSPVGEKISGENPADPKLVNTEDHLDLKKGDVLVVWGKLDASFITNGIVPSFDLIYNLSLDGNTVSNATLPMFSGSEKRINSDYSVQEEEKEDRQESPTDSTEISEEKSVKASWEFEQEITRIPIEKDGKYTFDYKIKPKDSDGESMFNKTSIILRKN